MEWKNLTYWLYYYDKFNPHLRSLNANNTWFSDWDPINNLMYIIRKRFYECLKIPSFEDNSNKK